MQRFILILIALIPAGCIQRLGVRLSVPVIYDVFDSIAEEPDTELAREASSANLKILEAAIETDPNNRKLLQLACRGFAGYALAFVSEDEPERARDLLERARDYGFRALRKSRFRGLPDADLETVKLSVLRLRKKDVAELFWPTFAWGYWINLSRDQPAALVQLPRVEVLMNRLLELDEGFFYGGPHVFFALLYSSRAETLGGQPEKAKEHFDKAIKIANGKFLLTYYFYARYYAVVTQNQALCEELLNKVVDAPSNLLPEQRLMNQVSRKRAGDFLIDMEDYF